MTDNTKPRLALDLDEIERQLKLAQQGPAPKNDPLAELARIVGQDDPFQSILSGNKPRGVAAQHASTAHGYDDALYASTPQRSAAQAAYDAHQGYAQPGPYPAQAAHHHAPASDFGRMVDEAAAYDTYGQDYAAQEFEPAPPKRSRKGLMAVGAALGVAVIGVGGALAYRGGVTGGRSGEAPIVKAETAPLKVQPQNPGGVEIPNQNKQILERGAQDGQTKVVNREEQPVDVRQAARIIGSTEGQTGAQAPGAQSGPTAGLGEPKRVRTVSIRPDGSQISDAAPPRPAPTPVAAPVVPPPAVSLPRAAQPVAAPSTPSIASLSAPEPRTTSTTPQPRPAQAVPQASPMPASEARPAPKPAASKVASLQSPPTDVTAAPAASSGGGFAVQLAVRNSDQEARAAYKQLQQKFSGDLGSLSPTILKAESNGKTIYRVRVGSLSKDDASSLCSRIQGAGGQCFVSRNN